MDPDTTALSMLAGTPYTIDDDTAAEHQFKRVIDKSAVLADNFAAVGSAIREQAVDVFQSFGLSLRSELVAESNQIENLSWTPAQVREVVVQNRDLLALEAHSFLEGLRGDDHAYQALGLYKAQLVADEWASNNIRPRDHEIRQLHTLVTNGESHAGQYKVGFNQISGAAHIPPAPADAAEGMRQLASWLEVGSGNPILDATLVHAWLAHLHPFEDGNGRMSRLLANLALAQGAYPPLILSASSDRGEYYDALATSDHGDILPLFELFGRVLRRTVRVMGSPGYVESVIHDRLLTSESEQRALWQTTLAAFSDALRDRLRSSGWDALSQGLPNPTSFHALAIRNADGNSWFQKVQDHRGRPAWLLWFGFNSQDYVDVYDGASGYPSIFFSVRDETPGALHPYRPTAGFGAGGDVSELVLIPALQRPARLQEGYKWNEYTIEQAAERVARTLTKRASTYRSAVATINVKPPRQESDNS